MKRKLLRTFILSVFLLGCGNAFSQNILQGDSVNRELKVWAQQEAEMWTKELALSPKQTSLMERKLIEYALKKQELEQSKLRQKIKLEKLALLQQSQYKSMRDIFTRLQFDNYMNRIEQRIQKEQEQQKK